MTALSATTNLGAMAARRAMERNADAAAVATNELASGLRTYDPSRTPSEAAIGARLDAKISNIGQAAKNASQLIALIQMGTGTLDTMQNMITRMQSLTSQANNDALDDGMRSMLDQEYQKLLTQTDNLSDFTRWGNTRLFGGAAASATANGNVGEALSVNAIATAFGAAYNEPNTQGQISGAVSDASVKANGALFDVSVTFEDGKVFSDTVAAPVADEILVLNNKKDGTSSIGLTYANDVSGFDGTAANFEDLLKQHLGLGVGGIRSVGTTSSIAMYGGATVNPNASADSGVYAMTYTVNGNEGTFKITDGTKVSTATVATSNSISKTVNIGDFSIDLSNFDGSASLGQVGLTVTSAGTLTMGGQIEDGASDVIDITFKAINADSLGLKGTHVNTRAAAQAATDALKGAAETISNLNAQLGGTRSQLDFQVDSLKISEQNQTAAKSTYTDANIAEATERLTKYKALTQISSSVFSQAIQDTQRLAQLVQNI